MFTYNNTTIVIILTQLQSQNVLIIIFVFRFAGTLFLSSLVVEEYIITKLERKFIHNLCLLCMNVFFFGETVDAFKYRVGKQALESQIE